MHPTSLALLRTGRDPMTKTDGLEINFDNVEDDLRELRDTKTLETHRLDLIRAACSGVSTRPTAPSPCCRYRNSSRYRAIYASVEARD
jgi:hypothetical protein